MVHRLLSAQCISRTNCYYKVCMEFQAFQLVNHNMHFKGTVRMFMHSLLHVAIGALQSTWL